MVKAWDKWFKRFATTGLTRCGHRSIREAVIPAIATDDLVTILAGILLPTVLPRHFYRGLIGFRTAIAEVDVVQIARQKCCKFFRQKRSGDVNLRVWVVWQLLDLFIDGISDLLPSVADIDIPKCRVGV